MNPPLFGPPKLFSARGDRSVELCQFHVALTYGNVLAGLPNPELNAMMLRAARTRARRLFRPAPVVLVPPIIKVRTSGTNSWPQLPVWTNNALLESDPVGGRGDFSLLAIVWYHDDVDCFFETLDSHLKEIEWDRYAKECHF